MKKLTQNLRSAIGITISLLLVYFVLFRPKVGALFAGDLGLVQALFGSPRIGLADLHTAWEMLIPSYALVAAFLLAAQLFVRAFRWKIIINEAGEARYWNVFHAMNIGYLLNNVLPLRAGELLRAIIVANREGNKKGSMLTTVVVERLFDLSGLSIFFGLSMLIFPFPTWLKAGGGLIIAATLGMLITGYFLSRSTEKLEAWLAKTFPDPETLRAKIASKLVHLVEGLAVLKRPRALVHSLWTTLLLWATYIVVMKLIFEAFQMTNGQYPALADGGWVAAAVVMIITALGFAIPSAPGGVGTYHAAVLLGLSWFGVPEGMAVIFATVMHAVNYIVLTAIGAYGLFAMKLSWKDVVGIAKSSTKDQPLPETSE